MHKLHNTTLHEKIQKTLLPEWWELFSPFIKKLIKQNAWYIKPVPLLMHQVLLNRCCQNYISFKDTAINEKLKQLRFSVPLPFADSGIIDDFNMSCRTNLNRVLTYLHLIKQFTFVSLKHI